MPSANRAFAPLARALSVDPSQAPGEDGYDLWLRYRKLPAGVAARVRARSIVVPARASVTLLAAAAELARGLEGLLGRAPAVRRAVGEGALVLATPASMKKLGTHVDLERLGDDGYALRVTRVNGRKVTLIAANTDRGVLYGAFAWLRAVQMRRSVTALDEWSAPKVRMRMLNHWDNLDRSIERGYAGNSIWDWWKLPDRKDARYVDYARAVASLGINGVSVNNVSSQAEMLSLYFIRKAVALAEVFRPYGIRIYFAIRFSSPIELDGLATADPLDPAVRAWWKRKADEIYRAIPDFGGWLIKANSEGQPGPFDYGRDHADGANMLAEALAPHGGIVLWRAFVYSQDDPEDRHKQAFTGFKPLDGKFAANVMVQVKNGAIDFQPREPVHPMFGAMPKTPLVLEFQLTKEYLGFATHVAYLGEMYEEALATDMRSAGPGSTLARITDGTLSGAKLTGMSAVANIGCDRNWCGSHFDQANLYAFGRLAWDPYASSRAIAAEWVAVTFTPEPRAVEPIVEMMMRSREAVVGYMTPLGLAHLMDTGHHHGPGPWVSDLKRPEWNPTYYHRADRQGIGFDRSARGSNAVSQYAPALAREYSDPRTTPEKFLLWFHHLPWDWRMRSGRTLWAELVAHYDAGVDAAADLRRRWQGLEGRIDARRFREVDDCLAVQVKEAGWWRDACIAYFRSVNGLAMPKGTRAPPLSLEEYRTRRFPYAPGRGHAPRAD